MPEPVAGKVYRISLHTSQGKKQEVEMGEENLKDLGLSQEELNALSEEEKKELLGEEKPKESAPPAPQEDEKEKAIRGLVADLQKERQEKREFKAKLEELEEKYQAITEALQEAEKSPEAQESLGLTDEDYLNFKTARKLLEEKIASLKNEIVTALDRKIDRMEDKFIALSEKEIASKYSPEKVGEELSYEKVIEEGLKPLLQENPALKLSIKNSANPAEAAYKLGLTHPKFIELLAKKKAEEVIKKLTEEKPKTGGGGGGATGGFNLESASIDDLLKLSDKELDELAQKHG
ncbi:MAG: hypothetical protein AB7E08_03060 [Candidatus Omnitrophota bacterium]